MAIQPAELANKIVDDTISLALRFLAVVANIVAHPIIASSRYVAEHSRDEKKTISPHLVLLFSIITIWVITNIVESPSDVRSLFFSDDLPESIVRSLLLFASLEISINISALVMKYLSRSSLESKHIAGYFLYVLSTFLVIFAVVRIAVNVTVGLLMTGEIGVWSPISFVPELLLAPILIYPIGRYISATANAYWIRSTSGMAKVFKSSSAGLIFIIMFNYCFLFVHRAIEFSLRGKPPLSVVNIVCEIKDGKLLAHALIENTTDEIQSLGKKDAYIMVRSSFQVNESSLQLSDLFETLWKRIIEQDSIRAKINSSDIKEHYGNYYLKPSELGKLDLSADHITDIQYMKSNSSLIENRAKCVDIRFVESSIKGDDAFRLEPPITDERHRLQVELTTLRSKIMTLNSQLTEANTAGVRQAGLIQSLERRLNRLKETLVAKDEELARYRSEFFGDLRQLLDKRKNVRIVGDRFVFQSEVLFDEASARLKKGGEEELARLAMALNEIDQEIPSRLSWVLQVNGHADQRAMRGGAHYRDNWELSAARAIAVVRYLNDQGVPATHLAAAGFAHYQPLNPAETPEAHKRNRRIEFKLTTP